MQQFVENGTTLFLVSHNLQTVKDMCSRAIWIDKGQVQAIGEASEVVEAYRAASNQNAG
jgi:lipopolysaccharide transport system ATP-binding protein